MMIPAAVEEMDKRYAALGHAAGEDAVAGKRAGPLGVGAVQVRHALGFLSNIHQLRHARLHAEGHLVLRNAGLSFGIAEFLKLFLIDLGDSVKHAAAQIAVDSSGSLRYNTGSLPLRRFTP